MSLFKDIFSRKLQDQEKVARASAARKETAAVVRSGIQAEIEPKLRAIVLETFETMREMKWPVAQVVPGRDQAPTGVTAYAFSPFDSSRSAGNLIAQVVIDSDGKIALHHHVQAVGGRGDQTVVRCYPLDRGYEELLRSATRTDTPEGTGITLNREGGLMFTEATHRDLNDDTVYKTVALTEYLATRAAHTIAGT